MKKNKILLLLFITTFLLLLLLILSSKILTIKSGSIEDLKKESNTRETVEMEKVREDYLLALKQVALKFDNDLQDFESLVSATSTDFNHLKADDELKQIISLENDLTALLVPPEYRKIHLNLVLQFRRITLEGDYTEVLKTLKLISLQLNAQ